MIIIKWLAPYDNFLFELFYHYLIMRCVFWKFRIKNTWRYCIINAISKDSFSTWLIFLKAIKISIRFFLLKTLFESYINNNFGKAHLRSWSASLLSRSMNNSLFERYLDVIERTLVRFLILNFFLVIAQKYPANSQMLPKVTSMNTYTMYQDYQYTASEYKWFLLPYPNYE